MTTLDELYARIPPIDCRGKCQTSCGPILMSEAEHAALRSRGFDIPHHDPATIIAGARLADPANCPALGAIGQCRVYDVRPMICRLWGVVEGMPCPHGCRPERVLTDVEGQALLRAAAEIPTSNPRRRRR